MKPFPKREDFPVGSGRALFVAGDAEAYQLARADWYRDEVVPLLREARDRLMAVRPIPPSRLLSQTTVALKACEEDKPC